MSLPIPATIKISTSEIISVAHFVHLADSQSPCLRFHGHDFRIEIIVIGGQQNDGMVVDFRKIKEPIKELDHKILLPEPSDSLRMVKTSTSIRIDVNDKLYVFPTCDCIILTGINVVTSENIAIYLLNKYKQTYPSDKFTVKVYEGEKSFAEVSG